MYIYIYTRVLFLITYIRKKSSIIFWWNMLLSYICVYIYIYVIMAYQCHTIPCHKMSCHIYNALPYLPLLTLQYHYITLHYITLHYITLHYITYMYIHVYVHTFKACIIICGNINSIRHMMCAIWFNTSKVNIIQSSIVSYPNIYI